MSDRQPPVNTWKEIGMPVFGILTVVAAIIVLIIKLTKPKSSDPSKSDPNSNRPKTNPNSNPQKKCMMKDENDEMCANDLSISQQDECYNYFIKHQMMDKGKCDHLKSLTKSGNKECKNDYKKLYDQMVKDGVCEADTKKHDLTCGQKLNQYQQLHPNACDEFSQAYNSESQINNVDVKQCYHDALLKNKHNFKGENEDATFSACVEQCSSSTFGVPGCRTLCTSVCRGL